MSNESPSTAVAVVPSPRNALAARGEHLSLNLQDYMLLANQLHTSCFAPKSFKSAADVLATLLYGRELGLGPMASLTSVAIVEGRPTLAADKQLGIFTRMGGKAEWVQLDDTGAVIRLTSPNGLTMESAFTMEDAVRAKLATKDVWQKYPRAMCRSRCITQGLKDIGFEPTCGLYDPEELSGAATIEEAKEPTSPETLKSITTGLVELTGLNPERADGAQTYYAANAGTIIGDEDEARKFLRQVDKAVAAEQERKAVVRATTPDDSVTVETLREMQEVMDELSGVCTVSTEELNSVWNLGNKTEGIARNIVNEGRKRLAARTRPGERADNAATIVSYKDHERSLTLNAGQAEVAAAA